MPGVTPSPLHSDVPQIALNWLLQRPTVATPIIGARNEEQLMQNLGATGWSLSGRRAHRPAECAQPLGAAVTTGLAAEHAPAALILRSPFTSMVDVWRFHYPMLPVRWLRHDRFASSDAIATVRSRC